MKYSVFSVMAHDKTPEELIPMLKEVGYHAVEWRFKETPEEVRQEPTSFWRNNYCTIDPDISDQEIEEIKKMSEQYGIKTLSITPYLQDNIKDTEKVLAVAQKFNASFIRLGVPKYDRNEDFNQLFKNAKEYLKQAEKLCKQYGVKGLIETHHNTIVASASAAIRLLDGLDPQHVGVLYDPGNMVHEGYENHLLGLQLLGDYVAHVHMKNAAWVIDDSTKSDEVNWHVNWESIEKGIVNWDQVIKDLSTVGYDGYIGIEDFSQVDDTKNTLIHNFNWLQKWTENI
ncbi:xylose isomerase domain protein TIM barrel [Gracilibacillus boraciitolerans JCM 21714]|uniref:Xylose isomerase domain protein TIM barrel n=1 Tax=Gracilibacillus boraciitolerans JCM 21714 TaxID=1298598 RepID=W4VN89_9BACI|nr:sugar phosphate isomerase/epimerase family protein [Gracilibacillus boraciitolerans]GAE94308.1 xylose isomerase domain protein TIM barrel [Gracilibacillus boraciitolerans JCM 21714]